MNFLKSQKTLSMSTDRVDKRFIKLRNILKKKPDFNNPVSEFGEFDTPPRLESEPSVEADVLQDIG